MCAVRGCVNDLGVRLACQTETGEDNRASVSELMIVIVDPGTKTNRNLKKSGKDR